MCDKDLDFARALYDARTDVSFFANRARSAYQELWSVQLQRLHEAEVRMRRAMKRTIANKDNIDVYIQRRDTVRMRRQAAEAAEWNYICASQSAREAMDAEAAAYRDMQLLSNEPQV